MKPILAILPVALALAACAPKPVPTVALVDPYAGLRGGAAAPVTTPAEDFRATAGDIVTFAADVSTLDEPARSALTKQADWLNAHPEFTALIEGHAAETEGTRAYAASLGARRAGSVEQFLIASGIAPLRLRTVSFGKERPIGVCSTEECYAKNRRARTVVTAGVGS